MASILAAEDVVRRIAADCACHMSTSTQIMRNNPPDSRAPPRTVTLVAESGPSVGPKAITKMGGADVTRPRAADDFPIIRARMAELRREREGTKPSYSENDPQRGAPIPRGGAIRWPPSESSWTPERVRRSG